MYFQHLKAALTGYIYDTAHHVHLTEYTYTEKNVLAIQLWKYWNRKFKYEGCPISS